jgi:hypothetical protein
MPVPIVMENQLGVKLRTIRRQPCLFRESRECSTAARLCPGVVSPLGSWIVWLFSPATEQVLNIAEGSIAGNVYVGCWLRAHGIYKECGAYKDLFAFWPQCSH